MRKNRPGRIAKFDRELVVYLRDKKNLSFTEIAEKLKMGSKQLARYYYITGCGKLNLTKKSKKNKIRERSGEANS